MQEIKDVLGVFGALVYFYSNFFLILYIININETHIIKSFWKVDHFNFLTIVIINKQDRFLWVKIMLYVQVLISQYTQHFVKMSIQKYI